MSFDPREPRARLLVEGRLGKQQATFLLDTGVTAHLVSPELVRSAHLKRGATYEARDVFGQTRTLRRLVGALDLPGIVMPVAPIYECDLTRIVDVEHSRVGGILAPQSLVAGDDALRIDIPRARMEQTSKKDAFSPPSDRALLLADVPRDPSGQFFVTAKVGDRDVSLIIDTGAPQSALFIPPDGTLPAGAYGQSTQHARLEVGTVRRDLVFDVIEPMTDLEVGGLLGLDVLQNCTLATSSTRLRVTCDDKPDLGAARAPTRSPAHDVCFGSNGPCLRELAAGDLAYGDQQFVAHVDARGRVRFSRQKGGGKRPTKSEREWLMNATRGLRAQLDFAHSMRTSFDSLPRLLNWVWTRYAGSSEERRAVIFRLWAGCAEANDPQRADAGERARRVITAFVRGVAPAGSADAFSADELELINADRTRRFDPYTPERDPVDVP